MCTRPRQLTPAEAFEEIQRILIRYGIGYSGHARRDTGPGRGVKSDDVERVLKTGVVSTRAEWDDQFCNWKYRVTGKDYDNDPLVVIVALDPGYDRLTVITVHGY
jgi:hypothetical protein